MMPSVGWDQLRAPVLHGWRAQAHRERATFGMVGLRSLRELVPPYEIRVTGSRCRKFPQ
jgi:hypothetical protein